MALQLTIDDRKKLLQNPQTYFTASERFLSCCKHIDRNTDLPIPEIQHDFGTWRGSVLFSPDYVLRFREVYTKHEDDLIERVASYDFRKAHSNVVTFRVDAHGGAVWNGEKFHLDLDLPDKVTYEDGDNRLKGFSLSYFTMVDMIYLINLHLEGEALPWG